MCAWSISCIILTWPFPNIENIMLIYNSHCFCESKGIGSFMTCNNLCDICVMFWYSTQLGLNLLGTTRVIWISDCAYSVYGAARECRFPFISVSPCPQDIQTCGCNLHTQLWVHGLWDFDIGRLYMLINDGSSMIYSPCVANLPVRYSFSSLNLIQRTLIRNVNK